MNYPSDIAFTPTVKDLQTQHGSRAAYARMESSESWETTATPELTDFLSRSDMFYLGTTSSEGQPYIQYRGGPRGFLKVIDESTLAFADFGGNKQFISTGNLQDNPKAFIFLMDYENRQRIKIWGTAQVIENDAELLHELSDPNYPGKVERAIVFDIGVWMANCPQHIHQRIPKAKVDREIDALKLRIELLEAELVSARN